MKNQKGFIQIPLLIAIIAGVLVIGEVSYLGVKQYKNYQTQKIEKDKLVLEERQKESEDVKKKENDRNLEIENLKKEVGVLKNQQTQNNNKNQPLQSDEINSIDLQPYLNGVLHIGCKNVEGSGSLWNIDGKYSILTNRHVINDPYSSGYCNAALLDNASGNLIGMYVIYPYNTKQWNYNTDVALLELLRSADWDAVKSSPPIASLNFQISSLSKCQKEMPIGSPVVIIGYPAFGMKQWTSQIEGQSMGGKQPALIATNGVISGYDSTVVKPIGSLLYPNYFVSAKIDSGNSGGIAISKIKGSLCVLGIPTWLNVGNYENQGLIQNIHNVMYQP